MYSSVKPSNEDRSKSKCLTQCRNKADRVGARGAETGRDCQSLCNYYCPQPNAWQNFHGLQSGNSSCGAWM